MTNEEKVIERANKLLELKVTPFNNNKSVLISKTDLETVLNMLKEKDSEIERLEQTLARNIARNVTSSMKESAKSKEDLEMLNAGWQIELEKKDKIIDLMAEFLGEKDMGYYKKEEGGEFLGIMRRYSKEDWKQYFERKSEK